MPKDGSRSIWKTKLKRLSGYVVVALLASGATSYWLSEEPSPIPPLLQDMPWKNFHDIAAQETIDARLLDRFPIGSPENDLIHVLWREGFRPWNDWQTLPRGAGWDRAEGFICRRSGVIRWSVDDSGRLTAISGQLSIDCL